MFNIESSLNLTDATNLYLRGEKSQHLIPINNNNKDNDLKENELEKKLSKILKDSTSSESVIEINDYLTKIKSIIDNNLKRIEHSEKKSIIFLRDFGKYFDINLIIDQLGITIPVEIFKVLEIIENKVYESFDSEIFEKCLYMLHVCKFLYYEEFMKFYMTMKDKIQQSNIGDIFSLNEAKNILIKEAKSRIELIKANKELIGNIWKNLENEEFFIENEKIKDKIKTYISQSSFEIFVKDFSSTFAETIKEINLDEKDPQNLFLKPFMIQHKLYCETD